MGSLLTARNLPGIGDASPPDDEDLPECPTCDGEDPDCSYCHGRGFPEPDGEPDFDPAWDCPPYEGP